jgi:hypothetical protein
VTAAVPAGERVAELAHRVCSRRGFPAQDGDLPWGMGSIGGQGLMLRRLASRHSAARVLQRCGDHACPSSGCSSGQRADETLRRNLAPSGGRTPAAGTAPPVVTDALRSPGRALDPAIRDGLGARFGHDFGRVRVHTDATAARSAEAVGALAYTVGSDVVFARGAYRPSTPSGTSLLAHELAHVVQQGDSDSGLAGSDIRIAPPGDDLESDAERHAHAVVSQPRGTLPPSLRTRSGGAPTAVQRRMVVTPGDVPMPPGQAGPPTPFTLAVQGLLHDTCPSGGFTVDPKSGLVSASSGHFCVWHRPLPPGRTEAAMSPTPAGCSCLCDAVSGTQTTTIAYHAGPPFTAPGAAPPGTAPGTMPGTGGAPTSPTVNADPRFHGQYLINGHWTDIPFHLILAHEVCGHAVPLTHGTQVPPAAGPPGGTPPHERVSVDVERAIAAEHQPPLPRRPEDYGGGARQRP